MNMEGFDLFYDNIIQPNKEIFADMCKWSHESASNFLQHVMKERNKQFKQTNVHISRFVSSLGWTLWWCWRWCFDLVRLFAHFVSNHSIHKSFTHICAVNKCVAKAAPFGITYMRLCESVVWKLNVEIVYLYNPIKC